MTLSQPIWLLLLIPLGMACWVWPLPTRLLQGLRVFALVSLVLAMCQPAIELPDRSGTIVVVADRSESMPGGALTREKEIIDLMQKSMSAHDRLAVVSFGHKAVVERPPQSGEFGGFAAEVGAEASSLADGLETALAMLPNDAPGRVLVVSDGKWTGRDPSSAAAKAAGRSIPIDYRHLTRPPINDLAIQGLHAPETVLPGEAYMVTAWVQSPVEQEVEFQLLNGTRVVDAGKRKVQAGLTRMIFRDRALKPGTAQYQFKLTGDGDDSVPENNLARALVGIRGTKPVFAVSNAGNESGLTRLLQAGEVDVTPARAVNARWSLAQLSQYSAVLLENVMAGDVGTPGMELIANWVEQTGTGLMMTGGKKSYAPGGYFASPLERVLPVSLEMRSEHRKLKLSIVVVLDRSGSMGAPVGGNKTKMDLANLGTAQVMDLLGPLDEFGVIATDSRPHTILDIDLVENNRMERATVLSIQSMGGGIFVYSGLAAAAQMIYKGSAETKHIILFSDAMDSEEPGDYINLLQALTDAGVSVSVIGLGRDSDVDAAFLKDIAKRGNGNIYFTDKPKELPRIFAQDTFTVARSTFVEDETKVKLTAGVRSIGGSALWKPPAVGGYNLTYIRQDANMPVVSEDEYKAPVVANWQAGSGRVLCYTGEADGKWAGPIAGWEDVGDFYSTLVRWTAGEQKPLPDDMLITQEVRDGVNYVQLHLDPEREKDPFQGQPEVRILHGIPGVAPDKKTVTMDWKNADQLEVVVPIRGRETVLATVAIPGLKPQTLPPVCLPYSPEFAPAQANRGRSTLEGISAATGGRERLDLSAIWETLVAEPQYIDIAVWLIIAGLLAFLLEVFQRRTGLLAFVEKTRPAVTESNAESVEVKPPKWFEIIRPKAPAKESRGRGAVTKRKSKPRPGETKPASTPGTPKAEPKPEAKDGGNINALREAMKRAKKRRGD